MNDNEFKNVINNPHSYQQSSFSKTFLAPFISGILGCSLVLGTCFGVPSIKSKILSTNNTNNSVTTSTNASSNSGTINTDLVSLSNYSDTAVYAANKILPSIIPGSSILLEVVLILKTFSLIVSLSSDKYIQLFKDLLILALPSVPTSLL